MAASRAAERSPAPEQVAGTIRPRRAALARLWVRRYVPELLTAAVFVAGWALLTAGVVALTSPIAWLFGAGLLLISLGGWRLLITLVVHGLYALTREDGDA